MFETLLRGSYRQQIQYISELKDSLSVKTILNTFWFTQCSKPVILPFHCPLSSKSIHFQRNFSVPLKMNVVLYSAEQHQNNSFSTSAFSIKPPAFRFSKPRGIMMHLKQNSEVKIKATQILTASHCLLFSSIMKMCKILQGRQWGRGGIKKKSLLFNMCLTYCV